LHKRFRGGSEEILFRNSIILHGFGTGFGPHLISILYSIFIFHIIIIFTMEIIFMFLISLFALFFINFIICQGHNYAPAYAPGWCKKNAPARPGLRAGAKKMKQVNYSR
jgi:hypothetical protein